MEENTIDMLTKVVTKEKFKHCLDLIHAVGTSMEVGQNSKGKWRVCQGGVFFLVWERQGFHSSTHLKGGNARNM